MNRYKQGSPVQKMELTNAFEGTTSTKTKRTATRRNHEIPLPSASLPTYKPTSMTFANLWADLLIFYDRAAGNVRVDQRGRRQRTRRLDESVKLVRP